MGVPFVPIYLGFDVLTAATVKGITFSDVTSCTAQAVYSFRYSQNILQLFPKAAVTVWSF
jgi:hypothetical protein